MIARARLFCTTIIVVGSFFGVSRGMQFDQVNKKKDAEKDPASVGRDAGADAAWNNNASRR